MYIICIYIYILIYIYTYIYIYIYHMYIYISYVYIYIIVQNPLQWMAKHTDVKFYLFDTDILGFPLSAKV